MTDDDLAERERWLAQKLAEERERTFDMVAQAVGRMLAERQDERGADYLNREVAALWRTITAVQKSLAELHAERIRAISGNESVDAKKMN